MNSMTLSDDRVTRLAHDGPPVFLNHDDLVDRMAAKTGAIEESGWRSSTHARTAYRNRRAVWAYVSANPCTSHTAIAKACGICDDTARLHLNALIDLGYIRQVDRGLYRVDLPLIDAPRP